MLCGWLRIDTRQLKQTMATLCNRWAAAFTAHLQQRVAQAMEQLYAFMDQSSKVVACVPCCACT